MHRNVGNAFTLGSVLGVYSPILRGHAVAHSGCFDGLCYTDRRTSQANSPRSRWLYRSLRTRHKNSSQSVDTHKAAMKIYTKTGDEGETGLYGGGRVRKD